MKYDSFVSPKSNTQIEEIASAWRIALEVQDQIAPDMARLLENTLPELLSDFGFKIRLEEPKDLPFEAYTTLEPAEIVFSPVTYLRLSKWETRARFTAAHELGHLVMHYSAAHPRSTERKIDRTIPAMQSAEHQADRFAAAFLMPDELLRLNRFSISETATLFRVSEQSAELRLKELGLLPRRQLPDSVIKFLSQSKKPYGQ